MNQWFKKRFFLIIGCESVVLFAIAFGSITKHLPARAFGIIGLLNFVVMFMAIYVLIIKARARVRTEEASLSPAAATEVEMQRLKRGIKAYKRLMIMFAIFLIYGELVNLNSSPWIRIFGAAFDLGLIALFYRSMRLAQTKLKLLGESS